MFRKPHKPLIIFFFEEGRWLLPRINKIWTPISFKFSWKDSRQYYDKLFFEKIFIYPSYRNDSTVGYLGIFFQMENVSYASFLINFQKDMKSRKGK